ncbi:tetratricopeptide repeat protein [Pseudanabaena biceps]|nr:tetratricopeptide repeat protein [Pseudanabaena biceps]
MSNDLLQKLMAAQTDEERSWIVTENLLESLPEDEANALLAVAIPHWFDAEILAALCPELADRAEKIYQNLQNLSCVEAFPDRGHNVHELTRNQLLDRLWKDNPERFRELSGRASAYFAQDDKPENQIEWIYHLVIADSDIGISEFQSLAQRWDSTFHITELSSLIINLKQQFSTNKLVIDINFIKAIINFWEGRINFIFNRIQDALDNYEKAEQFFYKTIVSLEYQLQSIKQEISNYKQIISKITGINIGKSKIYSLSLIILIIKFAIIWRHLCGYVKAQKISVWLLLQLILFIISKFLIFTDNIYILGVRSSILESRVISATLYTANSLKALGDISKHLEKNAKALKRYESAITLYRKIDNQLGEANTLKAIGDVLQFCKQIKKALKKYEIALAIYREIGDFIGEANTLKAIGDVLQSLDLRTEALERYEVALAIYREIGDRLGEANTLQTIALLEEDPVIGLASSQSALNMYIEIGDKYSQARNLSYFTSKIQLKLGQKAEAISALTLASKLAQEVNYQPMVDYVNQKIAEINSDSQGITGWFYWIKSKFWKE